MQTDLLGRDADAEKYEAFVEKFKPKKTTDDCYTPPEVYDAVADWVASEYGVERSAFFRPFYPGGDYAHEDYSGKIVVDNPPFSILSAIIRFYAKNGVRFFLFAPQLTLLSSNCAECTYISCGAAITYANGANVNTGFITNLDDSEMLVRTVPKLYSAVKAANDYVQGQVKKQLPRYDYPDNVVTAARIQTWSRYGIHYSLKRSEAVFIRALDSQKAHRKTIFGSGYLISERAAQEKAAQEKAAQERAAAHQWQLSQREMDIIKALGK